jgi:hypothetical protein
MSLRRGSPSPKMTRATLSPRASCRNLMNSAWSKANSERLRQADIVEKAGN